MDQNQFGDRVALYRERTDRVITEFLAARIALAPQATASKQLEAGIRHATGTTGKRIRALLSYATAEVLSVPVEVADFPAAAIELLHTYSLVHDDLPAMDNADLRRGRPTVHKAFDEATAVLVGDALLTHAFDLLASADMDAEVRIAWVRQLAEAAGAQGMINGQAVDLEGESRKLTLDELQTMHHQKTGALIEASICMVASVAPPATQREETEALTSFGHHLGLAFQIRDDLLDVEAAGGDAGKPRGSDAASNKSTFVSLLGVETAREHMLEEIDQARRQLAKLEHSAEGLHWLADHVVNRNH